MLSNSDLRAKAREHLGGGIFQSAWLMTMLAVIIEAAIISITSSFVIGIIFVGPLAYGLSRLTVSSARGKENVDISDLFVGFSEDFGNTVLLGLMTEIFTILWGLLFVIPGIVKSYAYAMAPYIQQDAEDKNWKTCLDQSCQMMKGHKMKLFLLDLSFIGWLILGSLCCGIGEIFVLPYMQQARAEFYEDLKANAQAEILQ